MEIGTTDDGRREWKGRARRIGDQQSRLVDIWVEPGPGVVEMACLDTAVTVAEDPHGTYVGWVEAGHESDPPAMIQPSALFDMQFPYGVSAAVRRGQGTVVALAVEAHRDSVKGRQGG